MLSVYFKNIKKELLSELDNAKESILIAVCWFTDQELYDKLSGKLSNGITVFLIIHNDYINNRKSGLPFQSLINKGCKLYFSEIVNPMMHNKFCIIDKKVLITGSYNWTYNAVNNSENILIIKNQPEIIAAFGEEYNILIRGSRSIKKIINKEINDKEKSFDFDYKDYLKKDIEIRGNFNSIDKLNIEQKENKKIIEFIPSPLLKIIEVELSKFEFKNNLNEYFVIFKVQDRSGYYFKLFVKHDQLEELKIDADFEELIGCSVELIKSWQDRVKKANNKSENKKFIYFDSKDKFHFSENYKKYKIEFDEKVEKKVLEIEKEEIRLNKLKKERDEIIKRANGL